MEKIMQKSRSMKKKMACFLGANLKGNINDGGGMKITNKKERGVMIDAWPKKKG